MSEPAETNQSTEQMSKLSQAIRDVKNDSADRDDVVVEMREASRMRLELLAQELTGVFEEAGKDDPQFDFAISSGLQPRLWIDATAHVAMGRDRRVYRFVRDTRLGRVVLAETADMKPVAEQVTRYVAERILERKRMMEGDVELRIVTTGFLEDVRQFLGQQFEPHATRLPHLDDDVVAIGGVVLHVADGL